MDKPAAVYQAQPTQVSLDLGPTLKFNGEVTDLCRIKPELLNDEIEQHPGTFAWLVVLSAAAAKAAAEAEDNLKVAQADMSQALREEAEKLGFKTTEEKIKLAINGSGSVIAARDRVNSAQYDADVAKGLLEAFKQRKDLIVCLANDRRSETRNL